MSSQCSSFESVSKCGEYSNELGLMMEGLILYSPPQTSLQPKEHSLDLEL